MQNPVQQTDVNKVELQIQQSKSAIIDMDRTTPNTAIDDSLGNIGSSSSSTGNNPKNSERMRQDEGNLHISIHHGLSLRQWHLYILQYSMERQPYRQFCMQTQLIQN